MNDTLTITVTHQHIDRGDPTSIYDDGLSLAIAEHLGQGRGTATVDYDEIRVHRGGTDWESYQNSERLRDWIHRLTGGADPFGADSDQFVLELGREGADIKSAG